jgi:hypothetical protein
MRQDYSRPVIPKKKKKKNGKENKNKSKQSDNTKYVLTTLLTEAKAPDVPLLHYLRSLFCEKTKRLKKGVVKLINHVSHKAEHCLYTLSPRPY